MFYTSPDECVVQHPSDSNSLSLWINLSLSFGKTKISKLVSGLEKELQAEMSERRSESNCKSWVRCLVRIPFGCFPGEVWIRPWMCRRNYVSHLVCEHLAIPPPTPPRSWRKWLGMRSEIGTPVNPTADAELQAT